MEAKHRQMFDALPKWSIEDERKARREFRLPLEIQLCLNETAFNNKISHRAGRGVFEEVFVNPSVQMRKKGQLVVSHMEIGYVRLRESTVRSPVQMTSRNQRYFTVKSESML